MRNHKFSVVVIKVLVLLILVLLCIAFITLLERKLLRYAQLRKGPNLVGPLGLLQPFRDGVKLLMKERTYSYRRQKVVIVGATGVFLLRIFFLRVGVIPHRSLFLECFLLFLLGVRGVGALLVFFSG